MKKILILGGTGFVGRSVCEQIERLQWRATVPTRRLVNVRLCMRVCFEVESNRGTATAD